MTISLNRLTKPGDVFEWLNTMWQNVTSLSCVLRPVITELYVWFCLWIFTHTEAQRLNRRSSADPCINGLVLSNCPREDQACSEEEIHTHRKNPTFFFQASYLSVIFDICSISWGSNTSSTSTTAGVPSEHPQQLLNNYSQLLLRKIWYLVLGNILCCIVVGANKAIFTHWLAVFQLRGDTGVRWFCGGRCRHIPSP